MYPMVWQDQAGELSDANANQLKHQVYLVKHLKIALPIVFAILAVLFIVMVRHSVVVAAIVGRGSPTLT